MGVSVIELVVNALWVPLSFCIRQQLLLRSEGDEENVAQLLVRIGHAEMRTVTSCVL